MYVLAHFTMNGSAVNDLSPKICITDIDTGDEVVSDEVMTALRYGYYKYNFTSAAKNKNYVIFCDGQNNMTGNERFKYQVIEVDRLRGVEEK